MITTPNIAALDDIYLEYYKYLPQGGSSVDIAEMGELYGITPAGTEIGFDDFIGKNVVKMFFDDAYRGGGTLTPYDYGELYVKEIQGTTDTIDIEFFVDGELFIDSGSGQIENEIGVSLSYSVDGSSGNFAPLPVGPYNQTGDGSTAISGSFIIPNINSTDASSLVILAQWFKNGSYGSGHLSVKVNDGSTAASNYIIWAGTEPASETTTTDGIYLMTTFGAPPYLSNDPFL